jgi:hypothetical protein
MLSQTAFTESAEQAPSAARETGGQLLLIASQAAGLCNTSVRTWRAQGATGAASVFSAYS